MLNALRKVEKALPKLLLDDDSWQSVFVNYHHPYVERVWRQWGDWRILLHVIHPCKESASLYHPHPWPSAMRLVSGQYEMLVGYGKGIVAPPVATKLLLAKGAAYEMINRDAWHAVRPLRVESMSIMVTGEPWDRAMPKHPTKPLKPLSRERKQDILDLFWSELK